MFEFNFEVNETDSSDAGESPFKKTKLEQSNTDKPTTDNKVEWYQAEEVKPNKSLLNCLDLYELNSKEQTIGRIELRHLIAGSLLEDIKTHSDINSRDIRKSEESHSDLIAGVYEGGAKIWECTDDLLIFLSKTYEKTYWENKRVLDLGCGSGLLGIYALKCGGKVDFQDYNKDVLEKITMPNVMLNFANALTDDQKLERLQMESKFYAGDWSHFAQLTENDEKYDLILTSETIYNVENQQKLLDTFSKRLKADGIVLVAGKSHYFGVGGGLEQFVELVKCGEVFQSNNLWHSDENLKRGIVEIKQKTIA
ncbi:histidine protein methyltransferase 1 homolog [Drosophila grimshawi]|uniref:protein-histidine N-methyltransferase n=1 Tax=Drosophila grimshawi TaxID=7222 RepID=B4JA62_DROGR|nr:histidine protein methyltransferase 1 homolog [Drosophila grimshawi]EDW03736.1 GH11397 [Drosophila grimshawi]